MSPLAPTATTSSPQSSLWRRRFQTQHWPFLTVATIPLVFYTKSCAPTQKSATMGGISGLIASASKITRSAAYSVRINSRSGSSHADALSKINMRTASRLRANHSRSSGLQGANAKPQSPIMAGDAMPTRAAPQWIPGHFCVQMGVPVDKSGRHTNPSTSIVRLAGWRIHPIATIRPSFAPTLAR